MTVLRRLTLPVALALAAMATMSGPAFATTITSGGSPYSGPIEARWGQHNFDNGVISVTCQSSDLSGTIDSDGSGQITSWAFGNCDEDHGGYRSSISVEGLPYDFEVEHTNGSMTITSPVTLEFEGGVLYDCSATAPAGTITAGIGGGTDWHFDWQSLAGSGMSCWNGISWNGYQYVTTPADLQVEP